MKRIFTQFFLILFVVPLFGQTPFMTSRLKTVMQDEAKEVHHISILLKDKLDVLALEEEMVAAKMTLKQRTTQVLTSLRQKASDTQGELLGYLKNHPEVTQGSVKSYWIANVIYAKVSTKVVNELALRNDISYLDLNMPLELESYEVESCEALPPVPNGAEPGLKAINAHKLWAMGYTGKGSIALGADTGIDPNHPSLIGQYRGLYFDDSQTWYHWQNETTFPNDCQRHGTHTIGTVLGMDRMENDTIGVAPNATYIGAQIICANGIGTADNIESFQWAIDPDGDPTTTEDIPHIVNNSWQDPSLDNQCESIYVDVFKAMEAVGIAVVFSAGNSGPGVSSITPPKNINYDELNVFCVGMLDANTPNLLISRNSSRGPSICLADSALVIKPEVSAPGVSVRSGGIDGAYEFLSGTSMAAPHVAGSILLLKEAFPDLGGREFKNALYRTARDLGDPGEDNTYGMGIIDVEAAFNFLVAEGNTPVNPDDALDVVQYHVKNQEFYCNGQVFPEMYFENLGTEEVTSMTIEVNIPDAGITEMVEWTGSLMPGGRNTVVPDPISVDAGSYEIITTVVKVNGKDDDEFLYNNRLSSEVIVTERESLDAYLADRVTGEVCENTQALLRNDYTLNTPGTVTYEWYNQPAGGQIVGTGQAFLTPPITQDRTYYADILAQYNVGPTDNSFADVTTPPIAIGGIVFDVAFDFTLQSVKVYTTKTGFVTINLLNGNNEELFNRDYPLNQVGENVILLNQLIPEGDGYKMTVAGGTPIAFNRDGATFPYEIDGVITLTGNIIPDPPGFKPYYSFYDWKIVHREVCGRTAVPVKVIPSSGAPTSDFTPSSPTVDINNDPTVQFSDASAGAVEWLWNFGDGTTSTDQNPSHSFTRMGTFFVSLTVTNADGCTNSSIQEIEVVDSSVGVEDIVELQGVKVFPNPTQNELNIEVDFEAQELLTVQLTDLLGKPIRQLNPQMIQKGTFQMNIADLNTGVYLIVLRSENGRAVRKILKI